jgi:hypothetical protein
LQCDYLDDTWKQATSYCETAAPFAGVEVVRPFPAYTAPAVPPFSLNADPGAPAAWPGSVGAVELRHVCDGCPVPLGLVAAGAEAAGSAEMTIAATNACACFIYASFPCVEKPVYGATGRDAGRFLRKRD